MTSDRLHLVYIVGANPTGPLKIGVTSSGISLSKRLASLQVGCSERLRVFATFHAATRTDANKGERGAHLRLADRRLSGEWFRVDMATATAAVIEGLGYHYPNPWDELLDMDGPLQVLAKKTASIQAESV